MRRLALGLACLLVTAGCLVASAQTESAMSLEDTARDRADENLEDPRLIGLWGVETPTEVEGENETLRVHLDDEPGDGNAAGWAFRFVGQERTGIIVVGDEIGVIAEYYETFEQDEAEDEPEALAWEVDSEDAAETLRANDSWPTMTDAHALSWELERDDEENGTLWSVEARELNTSGPDQTHVGVVDAETGEIVAIHADDDDYVAGPDPAEPEEGREAAGGCQRDADSGQVTPTQSLRAGTVLPEEGRAQISFDYGGAGPVDLTLSQDGEAVWEDSIMATGGDRYTAEVDDLDEGDYTLEATTDAGSVSGTLELVTAWGHADDCATASDYGPTEAPVGDTPGWVYADRTLGVAVLG